MLRIALISAALAAAAATTPAIATTVTDPVDDFISSYTGPHQADLDVTSFSVTYSSTLAAFLIQSTLAGPIDPALGGFYAIGVNTGTGPANFAAIGLPGVRFNQVIAVQKNGSAAIGATTLAPGSVTIGGNALSVVVPLSLLPSTGFTPEQYGFNIWPRSSTAAGTAVISDFAPDNATIAANPAALPEPVSWMLMVTGFGAVGATLRARRSRTAGSPVFA